jgi:MFS family permease
MTHTRQAPIHRLGISQILAYGLLFYSFASIKDALAASVGVSDTAIINALSVALFIEAVLAPFVGSLVDRLGAISVLRAGLVIGGIGYGALTLIPTIEWIWFCIGLITLGHALGTYTVAFAVPVQFDESTARRKISMITFYGGVASSLTWLATGALLPWIGIEGTTLAGGLALIVMGALVLRLHASAKHQRPKDPEPFRWSLLERDEKRALTLLAASGAVDYINFTGLTLLFITWFTYQGFGEWAVVLAAVYGPFQVLGRVFEMYYAQHRDARVNCVVAMVVVALSQVLILSGEIWIAAIGMALFGMANGVITVTFGYVPNLYFRGLPLRKRSVRHSDRPSYWRSFKRLSIKSFTSPLVSRCLPPFSLPCC